MRSSVRAHLFVAPLLLLSLAASAAMAQPYDLDPARWYPLEIGNFWAFENVGTSVDVGSRHVVSTTRDSLVAGHRWTRVELVYSSLPPERAHAAAPLGWQRLTEDHYLLRTFDFGQIDTLWTTVPRALFTADTPADSSLDVVFRLPGQSAWSRADAVVSVEPTYYRGEPCCRADSTNFVLRAELWPGAHDRFQVRLVYNLGHVASGETHEHELIGARVGGRAYGDTTLIRSVRLARDEPDVPRLEPRLDVFPNPARDRLTLAFDAAAPGLHHIRLFDALGREVFREPRRLPAGPHRRSLDLRALHLPAGLYVVRVSDGGRPITSQPVVIR